MGMEMSEGDEGAEARDMCDMCDMSRQQQGKIVRMLERKLLTFLKEEMDLISALEEIVIADMLIAVIPACGELGHRMIVE